MSFIEDMADELAIKTLEITEKTGDESIIMQISEILGTDSVSSKEAFMTSIRVRKADIRAREFLATINH